MEGNLFCVRGTQYRYEIVSDAGVRYRCWNSCAAMVLSGFFQLSLVDGAGLYYLHKALLL